MVKTRADQQKDFNFMLARLLSYAVSREIPIRLGEAQRTAEQAEAYAKAGTGTRDSKHRYGLAVDLWITTKHGLDIAWGHPDYSRLGAFWADMGGVWGGMFSKYKDVYHFEYAEKPLKK
jgi:hypothetical protein